MAFAVALVGLTPWLGRGERARANAVLLSLGASVNSICAFVWSEALVLLGFGLPFGLLIGTSVAWMMVHLLGGMFDPPHLSLALPGMRSCGRVRGDDCGCPGAMRIVETMGHLGIAG